MKISIESPNQPDVMALIEALDAYQVPLYPTESHHGIDMHSLSLPNVLFAVIRGLDKKAIGCGAIVLNAEYGEIKRMFVLPEYRGKGLANKLLEFLELKTIEQGCFTFTLETGTKQPEAIGFYKKVGYEYCEPFGEYLPDPNSIFMCKTSS